MFWIGFAAGIGSLVIGGAIWFGVGLLVGQGFKDEYGYKGDKKC
jgi:hypothetical protein